MVILRPNFGDERTQLRRIVDEAYLCTFYLGMQVRVHGFVVTRAGWWFWVSMAGLLLVVLSTSRRTVCRAFEAGKVQAVMRRRVWGC